MNIVVLNNEEEFIQFLDPELCSLTETIEKGGLRTLHFTYYFQDMVEDKKLFKIGNKLWVYGDSNLEDCLYVINTSVKQDIYQENCFECEMEEVLVELNYAPPFTQLELTSNNGFSITTSNGQVSVKVDYAALNYWFGEYFNIGVVQKCLSDYNAQITFTGAMNLMNLLRYIEEETGNIFVTRYEKDCLNNTIHRYLDFLNPINVSKPWVLNLEYDFLDTDATVYIYDDDGNPATDDYDDVEDIDDIVDFDKDYTPVTNIDPTNVVFRITNGLETLGTDGMVYTGDDDEVEPLLWTASDVGFEDDTQSAIISLQKEKNYIGMVINEKSFAILDNPIIGDIDKSYSTIENTITEGNKRANALIPDDSFFEIYDTSKELTVFRTQINYEIGHVHEEILDFGFNIDNVELEIDETDTYTAISPILNIEENELTRADMQTLLTNWKNLSVTKGDTMPMILEKVQVQGSTLANARNSMGTMSRSNYYTRPFHPQDQIDTNTPANSTWEFIRGTAYWKAPYTKMSGEMHISTDAILSTEYSNIQSRPDLRDGRDIRVSRPKIGTLETSSESYMEIYNLVCNKLREKQAPEFHITVDVANLRNGVYNDYQLHDKVYVKIPDMNTLLTARVVKTVKEGHDIAKNTIELSSYSVQTVKQIQNNTFVEASNVSFKYPNRYNYTVRLVNMDYISDPTDPNYDPDAIQYPANKLLTFHLYQVKDGMAQPTKKTYTKVTNAYGQCTLPLKYDPGDYQLAITFGGDEEYLDCTMTVDVNVSGVKQAKTTTTTKKKKTTKSKTTKKTANKKKDTKAKKNKAKKVTSTKTRTITGNPSAYVRKLALNIVGDSTGLAAAKKIVKYVDSHVKYELYANFHRSPDTVLKKGRANCCDQARTVLTLCDAAGCTSSLTLKYVHVQSGSKGHVFCKIITKSSGKWRYVDTCKWGGKAWGNYVHGYGTPPGTQTTYPTKPFQN